VKDVIVFSYSFLLIPPQTIGNLKRILLVDDEADLISLFKMVLEMNGYEVTGSISR